MKLDREIGKFSNLKPVSGICAGSGFVVSSSVVSLINTSLNPVLDLRLKPCDCSTSKRDGFWKPSQAHKVIDVAATVTRA